MSKLPHLFAERLRFLASNHGLVDSGNIFRVLADVVITKVLRAALIRDVAQSEAVPTVTAARDDRFYPFGREETSG